MKSTTKNAGHLKPIYFIRTLLNLKTSDVSDMISDDAYRYFIIRFENDKMGKNHKTQILYFLQENALEERTLQLRTYLN